MILSCGAPSTFINTEPVLSNEPVIRIAAPAALLPIPRISIIPVWLKDPTFVKVLDPLTVRLPVTLASPIILVLPETVNEPDTSCEPVKCLKLLSNSSIVNADPLPSANEKKKKQVVGRILWVRKKRRKSN